MPSASNTSYRAEQAYIGWTRRGMNQAYCLSHGLRKVRVEMGLSVLAYNLKRAINILGVRPVVQAQA